MEANLARVMQGVLSRMELWKKAPESGLADEPNTRDYLVVVGTPDQPEKAFRLSSLGCDELANLVTAVHQDGYAYHDGETNEILKWILVKRVREGQAEARALDPNGDGAYECKDNYFVLLEFEIPVADPLKEAFVTAAKKEKKRISPFTTGTKEDDQWKAELAVALFENGQPARLLKKVEERMERERRLEGEEKEQRKAELMLTMPYSVLSKYACFVLLRSTLVTGVADYRAPGCIVESAAYSCRCLLLPLLMSVLKLKLLHTVIVITSHGKQTGKELSLLNHPDDPEYQKCETCKSRPVTLTEVVEAITKAGTPSDLWWHACRTGVDGEEEPMALEPEDKVSTEDVRVFSTTSMGEASIVGSPVDMVQQRIVTAYREHGATARASLVGTALMANHPDKIEAYGNDSGGARASLQGKALHSDHLDCLFIIVVINNNII